MLGLAHIEGGVAITGGAVCVLVLVLASRCRVQVQSQCHSRSSPSAVFDVDNWIGILALGTLS
jgi:hypothetical protein